MNKIRSALVATLCALAMSAAPGTAATAAKDPGSRLRAQESVRAIERQGSLKARTVVPRAQDVESARTPARPRKLSPGRPGEVRIGLPAAGELSAAKTTDGVQVFTHTGGDYSVSVNPMDAGLQLFSVIGSPAAPTEFSYDINGPRGSRLIQAADGAVALVDAEGTTAAAIDAPWARDARGRTVQTRFEIRGDQLVQVVDHRSSGVSYPVTADPKIFSCDWYTALCVKFTKRETRSLAAKAPARGGVGAAAFAVALCGKIPNVIISAGCTGVVTGYAYALGKSFKSAARRGRCVEVHFSGPVPRYWKTERC